MKTMHYAAAFLGLVLCAPLFADQAEVQKLIASGKYSEAVGQADTLLRDKGASVSEQYKLLMLKGEAALCGGQRGLATSAFNAAARIAPDTTSGIAAAANALVAQQAMNGEVRIGNDRYPIIKPDDRKTAMQKMADALMANEANDLQKALDARTLGPIIDVAPKILDMYVLEMEASGGTLHKAEDVARTLGKQSQDLIAAEFRRIQRDVDYTERTAYELNGWTGWTARGLTVAQRRDMEDLVGYLNRIRETVLRARRAANTLGGDTAAWDRLASTCEDLQDQVHLVLTRNY
jgi:hypothetical protein